MSKILAFLLAFTASLPAISAEKILLEEATVERESLTKNFPAKFDSFRFDATLSSPTSETTVPSLLISLTEKKESYHSFSLNFSDYACSGDYDLSVSYLPERDSVLYKSFESLIAWPETMEVEVARLGKKQGRHIYQIIINEEAFEVSSIRKAKYVTFSVNNGHVLLENVRLSKKESK